MHLKAIVRYKGGFINKFKCFTAILLVLHGWESTIRFIALIREVTDMYRVLLPVDRNEERSMTQARYVAGLPSAAEDVEVTVLFVFSDDDSLDPSADESKQTPENVDSVARVTEFFESEGVSYQTIVDRADPVQGILTQADNHDVDEIVLGGRKRSPAGKVLFGSVTMSVLRTTDIPVVVTGAAD